MPAFPTVYESDGAFGVGGFGLGTFDDGEDGSYDVDYAVEGGFGNGKFGQGQFGRGKFGARQYVLTPDVATTVVFTGD